MRKQQVIRSNTIDLNSWLHHLEHGHPTPIELDLSRIKEVAKCLHLLVPPFPVITVAGTNGKGSCVKTLEEILHRAGYSVGAYYSPHLLRYNERIRINNLELSNEVLCNIFAHIEKAREKISLTYFEFSTLAALFAFQQANIQVAILEVGMGGRLDAVNLIDSEVAIISTVALDHMEWLGSDREAIGFEKAGIIRKEKPIVCGDFDVPQSIHRQAGKLGSNLYCQGIDFGYEVYGNCWRWWDQNRSFENLSIPQLELQNVATALKALVLISERLPVSERVIREVMETLAFAGRFQVLAGEIIQIFDVAHNPAAAKLLAHKLRSSSHEGRTLGVVAMLKDKDQAGTVRELLSDIDEWFIAGLPGIRGSSAGLLAGILRNTGANVQCVAPTVLEAYKKALAHAHSGDRIIVFGSFYTVAEAMNDVHYCEA